MSVEQVRHKSRAPYTRQAPGCSFSLSHFDERNIKGSFQQKSSRDRFELALQYLDGTYALFSVSTGGKGAGPDAARDSFHVSFPQRFRTASFKFKGHPDLDFTIKPEGSPVAGQAMPWENQESQILFDVSDLVYYIGHHDNLTGIQRVQACVLMGLVDANPAQARGYITFNNKTRDFIVIDSLYFEALLRDLSLPASKRQMAFDKMDARMGILPDCRPISSALTSDSDLRLVVYLLGAAWVNRDYFNRIQDLKRTYDAVFCMTVHDLIPIYAADTCDQGTAVVFEEFLRKSFLFTDHYFTVSENTSNDLIRFARSLNIENLPVSVIENGHALDEFFPPAGRKARPAIKTDYVLFVSTIEGRKNHSYLFDVWAELVKELETVPTLICVGRFGWRAERFLEKMLVSNNLGNKIRVLSDISDAELEALYANCLFTVYPSTYEGWGLPVGESLSKGKLCVTSDSSSLPEVAGEFGIYIRLDSVSDGVAKIGRLIRDAAYRTKLESRLSLEFVPRTWKLVAQELLTQVARLPPVVDRSFPVVTLGREYKLSQLPPKNLSALGYAMIAEVASARKGPITGYINRDEDLLFAQATRSGNEWYAPEDWGTWSRYPSSEKQFYVRAVEPTAEVTIYEKLRVVSPLIGTTLRISVNGSASQEFAVDNERFVVRVSCPVRADARGMAEITIRYELSQIGADRVAELDKLDGRRLGLGCESTITIDDSDLLARVSMLERLIFGTGGGFIAAQRGRAVSEDPTQMPLSDRGVAVHLGQSKAGVAVIDSGDQRSLSSPVISIGEQIAIIDGTVTRAKDPVENIFGRGWFGLEQDGAWSSEPEATLNFRLEQLPQGVIAISLDLRCLAAADSPTQVTIAANGLFLGAQEVRDSQYRKHRYLIDRKNIPDDRAFVILVHCDRLVSPSESGVSIDTRKLGVHVRSFGVAELPWLRTGQEYPIGSESEVIGLFANGWHDPEIGGIWSGADPGRIVGAFRDGESTGQVSVRMSISGRVYGTDITGPATVDLVVQGQVLDTWSFDDDGATSRNALLPLSRVEDALLLDVQMIKRNAVSPAEVGEGDDQRKLGLFIASVGFQAASLEGAKTVAGSDSDLEE